MGFSVNVEYHSFIESLQNVSRDSLNVGALFSTPEHRKYIDSGNYINALVLNRWVRYVDYVYHDKVGSELDVITKWFTVLEPCKLFRYSFSREAAEFDAYLRPISREDFFNDEQYDYVVFAKSPSFTVQATDKLVELAKKFVIEI